MSGLREAAEAMCGRYAEMLRQRDMLPEHSPTIRAVREAIAKDAAPPDPATIIRDLLATAKDSEAARDYDAIARAEAWLAENGE